jgi:PAS domain S-box-containing protein
MLLNMDVQVHRPIFDRNEFYESSARTIRWMVLALVLITYSFTSSNSVVVLTMIAFMCAYNVMRYIPRLMRVELFASRANSLAVDHVFCLLIISLSGGLASPYYPLFYILIIGTIACYGVAGFAFSLSAQVLITLLLLKAPLPAVQSTPEYQFIIKLVILIIFSLIAEQSVRSRDEEYLLEGRYSHRIENERQRLLALINSLSDAVLAIDDKGKVYLYNAAALDLLNTNRDINGDEINELLPVHDKSGKPVDLLPSVTGALRKANRQDLYYAAKDGSTMILDLTVAPVRVFGDLTDSWGGYIAVFHDITKQKSLDEERDEFISVTSHELRTPLAIAEANLSTALLPRYAKIEPKAKHLVEQAHQNIVFLSELIEDLTTLSRAERGDLKLESQLIEVADFTKELARDFRPQITANELELTTDIEKGVGSIYTSPHELREILQNFLTNANKYTSTGTITLAAEKTAHGTEFSVRDTGIGIAASDKSKIFTKFYRSEDYRIRQTGGTGLGLYITHKLAEKLGVQISFSSRLNHGSIFKVLVPIQKDHRSAITITQTAHDQPRSASSHSI